MERSGIDSERRTPSISRRLSSVEQNAAVFDSISNATSLMEVWKEIFVSLSLFFFCFALVSMFAS